MLKEAVILAGGLGTRLKGVISDIPKPMAPIQNLPFLQYLFEYLLNYKIEHVVLAVGYKYEVIENYFGSNFKDLKISYAVEESPLGTGGGIANALHKINDTRCFLLNGDTFFNVNLKQLADKHNESNADISLSLKHMLNFDRYGTVVFNSDNRITAFIEKQKVKEGYINGGVYIINKNIFDPFNQGRKFSFEQDIMEKKLAQLHMNAHLNNAYFIDIGIPEDYKLADSEIPKMFNF